MDLVVHADVPTEPRGSVGAPLALASVAPLVPASHPEPPGLVYLASLGSPRSREVMASALRRGWDRLGGQGDGLLAPWGSLRYADVLGLRARLGDSGLSPAGCNQILAAVRGACKQAWLLGLLPAEEWARLGEVKPISGERVPRGRALSPGECAALFEVLPVSPEGARDGALLAVLLGCGLRREEAGRLTLAAFDRRAFDGLGGLMVLGKGNKERAVALPPGARQALEAWLALRGPESGPLFPRFPDHRPPGSADWLPTPLAGADVAWIVKRAANRAGVVNVACHDLRRTCASRLLEATGDLALTQRYLRHASPATTARYDKRGDAALARGARLVAVPWKAS